MAKAPKGKGGRKVRGLFTRGKSSRYYCQYYVNGKQVVRALSDKDGHPATDLRTAVAARDWLLSPLAARDEEQRRRQVVEALRTAEEATEQAEAMARAKTSIANMWARKPWNVNRRGTTERPLSAGSIKDNRSMWTKFATWADSEGVGFAEDVTSNEALAFRDSLLAAKLSGDRVNKAIMACRVMFDLSEIAPNPFTGIRKQAHRPMSRRELTADELTAICHAAEGEFRPLFAIGLYTGMRFGDACSLDWSEIDAGYTRILRVTSKTDKEIVVPIHPVLAAILREIPRENGPVLPKLAANYAESTSRVSRWIQAHFTRCEIQTHKAGTGARSPKGKHVRAVVEVGFHSLRHSFITISAREGAPLHVIQALVGHASPAMQRVYLHASQADAERAIAALPSITGEVDPEAADRAKLAELARSLPIKRVREALSVLNGAP